MKTKIMKREELRQILLGFMIEVGQNDKSEYAKLLKELEEITVDLEKTIELAEAGATLKLLDALKECDLSIDHEGCIIKNIDSSDIPF